MNLGEKMASISQKGLFIHIYFLIANFFSVIRAEVISTFKHHNLYIFTFLYSGDHFTCFCLVFILENDYGLLKKYIYLREQDIVFIEEQSNKKD